MSYIIFLPGNSWGKDSNGKECIGCGLQETFQNCADISIGNDHFEHRDSNFGLTNSFHPVITDHYDERFHKHHDHKHEHKRPRKHKHTHAHKRKNKRNHKGKRKRTKRHKNKHTHKHVHKDTHASRQQKPVVNRKRAEEKFVPHMKVFQPKEKRKLMFSAKTTREDNYLSKHANQHQTKLEKESRNVITNDNLLTQNEKRTARNQIVTLTTGQTGESTKIFTKETVKQTTAHAQLGSPTEGMFVTITRNPQFNVNERLKLSSSARNTRPFVLTVKQRPTNHDSPPRVLMKINMGSPRYQPIKRKKHKRRTALPTPEEIGSLFTKEIFRHLKEYKKHSPILAKLLDDIRSSPVERLTEFLEKVIPVFADQLDLCAFNDYFCLE